MNRFAWSLPLLLVSAPAFSGTDGGEAISPSSLEVHRNAVQDRIDMTTIGDGNIILAQDSTEYDLKFEYSNSGYGQAEIANYGQAFKNGELVATAAVTDVQEIAANQARVRVEVTHFDAGGEVVYEGVVYYRKGLPGNVISENTVSGTRDRRIFATWPTW